MTDKTGAQIATRFELQVDDQSTLSSSETYELLNEVYREILDDRPWEWLKKEGTGTVSSGQITAPSDFKEFVANHEDDDGNFVPVVYIGDDYRPYYVIPFSKRNDSLYRQADGFAYYDARQGVIVVVGSTAEGQSAVFDYIYDPDDITSGTSPVFPARFHDIIFYGMAANFAPIDNIPKNRSYQEENLAKYLEILSKMQYHNSKIYGGENY